VSSTTAALTKETAHQALGRACEKVGVDPAGAELVRLGSNAVYRLAEPVIVRIGRDGESVEDARRQILVARWLEREGYPANRALHIDQPVDVSGHIATFWESVSERSEYADIRQVADIIRRFHDLASPGDLSLPEKRPFDELDSRLAHAKILDSSDADFLRFRIGELHTQYEALEFALPAGVIHGDANVGNVILSRDGNPVLIDLDSVCVGPREWDLVQTALFFERFGWHTADEYNTFVEVYGFDIMKWVGYRVLADYREIAMTLWLCGGADDDERAAAEVRKRVQSIKSGGNRRDWAPF
jgi:Ser/Thr protein kinase RdoA (MazF antagonist)